MSAARRSRALRLSVASMLLLVVVLFAVFRIYQGSTVGSAQALPAHSPGDIRPASLGQGPGRVGLEVGRSVPAQLSIPDGVAPVVSRLTVNVAVVGSDSSAVEGTVFGALGTGISGWPFSERVRAGVFQLDPRGAESILFSRLEMDSTVLFPVVRSMEITGRGSIDVQFEAAAEIQVRVIARDTARELEDVEYVHCSSPAQATLPRPPQHWNASHAKQGLSSPLRLPSGQGTTTYWLRSPGYAWRRLVVDLHVPGMRTVVLEPAGSLEINPDSNVPYPDAFVLVFQGEGQPSDPYFEISSEHLRQRLDGSRRLVLDDIPPGIYRVDLALGSEFRFCSIGSVTVAVQPGTTSSAFLELAPGLDRPCSLEVSISLGSAAGEVPVQVELYQKRHAMSPRGTGMVFRQSARPKETGEGLLTRAAFTGLPEGDYIVRLMPWDVMVELALPAGASMQRSFEAPELLDVTVLQATSPVEPASPRTPMAMAFSWIARDAIELAPSAKPVAIRAGQPSSIRCAPGPKLFVAMFDDGSVADSVVDITPETKEVVLPGARSSVHSPGVRFDAESPEHQIAVAILQDGLPVPQDSGWWQEWTVEPGDGLVFLPERDDTGVFASKAVISSTLEGERTATIPAIPGYLFDRHVTLRFPPGAWGAELSIELVPDL